MSLRQRRRPDDDDHPPTADEEEKRFAEHYRRQIAARSRAGPKTLGRALLLLVAIVVAIASILQWRSKAPDAALNRKDLVLISVYPRAVARFVHEIEGSPELLVTDDNKPAVEAVRAAIGLANTLRYDGSHKHRRRRKRGVAGALLGISNMISSLVTGPPGQGGGYVPGEIVLVTYGEAKMRGYLIEHGERCSNPPDRATDAVANAALRQFDGIATEMNAAAANGERRDALWSRALQIFVSCKFANGHAKGYVAHTLRSSVVDSRLREQLERARTTGSGLIVKARGGESPKEEEGDHGTHWSPLMVLPEGAASEDVTMEVSNSLLLGIDEERLQKWNEGGTAIGRLDLLDGQARLAPDGGRRQTAD